MPTKPTLKYEKLYTAIEAAIESKDQTKLDSYLRFLDSELAREDLSTDIFGKSGYFRMQKFWSWTMVGILTYSVVLQGYLISSVGYNKMDFREYKTFLNLIAGQNFLQIIGLCYIIVKYLFPDNIKKKA